MKRLVILLVVVLLAAEGAGAESVRVVGQRVNLRARADLKAEVIGQVADGDVLEARSFQEEWVEVAPPESVDLWVHKDFVQGGKVAASELKVRAGPGINYSVVARLERGADVRVRGEFTEWLKIAPPPGASLWVSRGYVEPAGSPEPPPPLEPLPSAAKPRAGPAVPGDEPPALRAPARSKPPPRPPPPSVSPPATARVVRVQTGSEPAARPPPAGLVLIPFEGQGRAVQQDGVLKYTGHLLNRPSRFRLVSSAGNKVATLCYVYGNDAQLHEFLGRRLLIRGREYWVRGVQHPVVVPDQIFPRARP